MSFDVIRSSFGYSMLLHSRQKRNVICSWGVLVVVVLLLVDGGGEGGKGEDIFVGGWEELVSELLSFGSLC